MNPIRISVLFCAVTWGLFIWSCTPVPFTPGQAVSPPSACPDGCPLRDELQRVLDEAHRQHVYKPDIGPDSWDETLRGDCEDFALVIRSRLAERGIESDIVIAITETGERHAVVSVAGWVLDNRYPWVMSSADLAYTWLKIGKRDGRWFQIVAAP